MLTFDLECLLCVGRWKPEHLPKPRSGAQQTGSWQRWGAIENIYIYFFKPYRKSLKTADGEVRLELSALCNTKTWKSRTLHPPTPPTHLPMAAELNLIRPGIFGFRCSEKGFSVCLDGFKSASAWKHKPGAETHRHVMKTALWRNGLLLVIEHKHQMVVIRLSFVTHPDVYSDLSVFQFGFSANALVAVVDSYWWHVNTVLTLHF